MKKKFVLEGLDCANCASKIEREICSIDGVENVSLNVFTTKLVIEGKEEKMDEISMLAEKIVNKYEPNVKFKAS